MRKYTNDIQKLYEAIGYEKIEIGKTYTTERGDKVTVKNIYIDATNEDAVVYCEYEIETTIGEKSTEIGKFTVLVDIIRAK